MKRLQYILFEGYMIRSRFNGFLLDLNNRMTSPGTRIVTTPMRNSSNGTDLTQTWYFMNDTSIQSVPAGIVIDINGGIYSTQLHLWPRYNARNQEWSVNGSYILCPWSNRAMTVTNSNVTTGVFVDAQPIAYTIYQEWDVIPA